ncbi:MAG TPA: MarR family transcriptional regulator [Candidatus Limnocylindria bacterium]|nr:MarR family transcriptional regulator [Candidatus Limnocylindria bacterium]
MTQTINSERTSGQALVDELGPLMATERAAFAAHCHERSISMAHVFVMSKLDMHGPMPMSKVAELIGSGLPTATGLVNRMVERGLVRREHDARDRRLVLVNLTDAGAAEVRDLHEARQRRMAAAIAQLSAAEQDSLLLGIRSLRSALERINQGDETR